MNEPVIFCSRINGRIGVYQKGWNQVRSQDMLRIGTIQRHKTLGEYLFFNDNSFFSVVKIDAYCLVKISEKLNELNRVKL